MKDFIVHLDMDSFYVSVEYLKDPTLKGKLIAVGGDAEHRGVISCASYEVRKYGVHAGMATKEAFRLCPKLQLISSDFSNYSKYSKQVYDILLQYAPVVEQASCDEFYLDLSGCQKLYGDFHLLLPTIKRYIYCETHLPCTIGAGKNRSIAKIASKKGKPDGCLIIEYGDEEEFLASLDCKSLIGVGDKTVQLLNKLGIHKVSQIQNLDIDFIKAVLGKNGEKLYYQALGKSYKEVSTSRKQKQMSTEHTFMQDQEDLSYLYARLYTMVQELCYDLRKKNLETSNIGVKIRYSDFKTFTKSIKVEPSNWDDTLYPIVKKLFNSLHTRRNRIRLLGVKCGSLTQESKQYNWLFSQSYDKKKNLYVALDKAKKRFGFKVAKMGVG